MTIKELRKMTGLSQTQFANRFNIPVRTLQQWEQGRTSPPSYVVTMLKSLLEAEESAHANGFTNER